MLKATSMPIVNAFALDAARHAMLAIADVADVLKWHTSVTNEDSLQTDCNS